MSGIQWRDVARVTGVVALLVGAPLVVAAVVLADPRWYPSLELAQTEIHVRDVGTEHTPLTGLIGRLGTAEERGSHPGPLSFYALAPVYRLLGSSAWALTVSTIVLNVLAAAAVALIALRRGGVRLAVPVIVALTVLLRFLGPEILTQPWIPYVTLLWWAVFLFSVWSVLDDDLALLPVAAAAGTFCTQTHISYGVMVGGLGAVALGVVAGRAVGEDRPGRIRRIRWIGGTALVGVCCGHRPSSTSSATAGVTSPCSSTSSRHRPGTRWA